MLNLSFFGRFDEKYRSAPALLAKIDIIIIPNFFNSTFIIIDFINCNIIITITIFLSFFLVLLFLILTIIINNIDVNFILISFTCYYCY